MTGQAIAILVAAGFAAGVINTIVGSGSLLTFPALLAIGYSPLVANVTNTVGLVLGSVSGAVGYRRELADQTRRLLMLGPVAGAGSLVGAVLLLKLPPQYFAAIVPALIGFAVLLVLLQPRLARLQIHQDARDWRGRTAPVGVFATAVYGGYFGAAQGVVLIAVLGVLQDDSLQRLNGLKNALVAIVNAVAAVYFIFESQVAWPAAGLIAISSVAGAQVGALVARKLPANPLRAMIILGGVAALVKLLV